MLEFIAGGKGGKERKGKSHVNRSKVIISEKIAIHKDSVWCSETLVSAREVLSLIPGPVKSNTMSPTARHRCDVSSELCCSVAKPRRWIPPLVTRFGVTPRV